MRPQSPKGHYWGSDENILRALNELVIDCHFLNPSASYMSELWHGKQPHRLKFIQLSTDSFVKNCIEYISNVAQGKKSPTVEILFNWLPDFSPGALYEFEKLSEKFELRIHGITMQSSEAIEGKSNSEPYIGFNWGISTESVKTIWVPDVSLNEQLIEQKLRKWVDFQTSDNRRTNSKSLTPNRNGKMQIGFFGQLSGYRGVGEFLIAALFNPGVHFKLRGSGFTSRLSWRPYGLKIFRYRNFKSNLIFAVTFSALSLVIAQFRRLPNVDFTDSPFLEESELNFAINSCDAVFICSKNRPGSGIVVKALNSGVPVIWNGKTGNLFELLNEAYPSGRFSYIDLFLPNALKSKIRTLEIPDAVYTWEEFKSELAAIFKNSTDLSF